MALDVRDLVSSSARAAVELMAAADGHPGVAGDEARDLSISLMCAANEAMAKWAKQVGRAALNSYLGCEVGAPDCAESSRGRSEGFQREPFDGLRGQGDGDR